MKKTGRSLGWAGMISHAAVLSEVRVERLQHWVGEILEEIVKATRQDPDYPGLP
jgi:hypothetical protein